MYISDIQVFFQTLQQVLQNPPRALPVKHITWVNNLISIGFSYIPSITYVNPIGYSIYNVRIILTYILY